MGKGMKLLRNTLIGLLAVICVAAAAVTLVTVFGDPRETATLERNPPDRGREEMLTTGNVFESDTDRFVWLASMPSESEVETWQFFPSIPVEAEPGDVVTLSVPALGFLSWESDSGLADIEFFDERIEADRAIASFAVPDGLFLVWASYEYISQESEGVMLIHPDGFEHGSLPMPFNPDHAGVPLNYENLPTASNPLRMSFGMFNNRYREIIRLVGFPDDAVAESESFYASSGGGGPRDGGPGMHGLTTHFGNNVFTIETPIMPNPEYPMERAYIGPHWFPQGMIDGDASLGWMPEVVANFTFTINITWPDLYNTVSIPQLDGDDNPIFIDGVQQFHQPGTIVVRPGGGEDVPVAFTVLPQPNIFRTDNMPLPIGMDDVFYGHRQLPDLSWTTVGHDTRINVEILDSTNAAFPPPASGPDLLPQNSIFWAFTIRPDYGSHQLDARFPAPDPVQNNQDPTLDLVLRYRPTTVAEYGNVGGNNVPVTFGVGENQRFVIRLSAFMRHPSAVVGGFDPGHREIGFAEQHFELTILPRPRFGLMDDNNAVFGLDALAHMMEDQSSAGNEPDESTSITRDTIVVAGLPARPDGGYTNWRFSWDFSEPWSIPPTSAAAGIPGPEQFPVPDTITGRSNFENNLPPGLSFRSRAPDWNGVVDNIMLGRATFDLIGVPPAGTFGRFIIGLEVDSFLEYDNLNIQTAERAEFELIIWPRTYLNASTRPTVGSHVRRVNSAGEPEQTIAFIEGETFLQWENRRAVMPGTMGIVSIPSTEFIRWEHNRHMTQPSNIPRIGGPVGTNVVESLDPNGLPIYNQLPGQQGHTRFTGHARTPSLSHNLMTMRMPVPWDSHNGYYDPYAPPANVFIEGVVSTNPPRIVFDGLPGRVELSEGRSIRVENAGDSGDNRAFRWDMFPSLQPEAGFAGLNPTLLESNNFLSVLQIAPTAASPPNEPY